VSATALFLSAQGRLRSGWRALLFVLLLSVFGPIAQVIVAIPGYVAGRDAVSATVALEMPLTWVALVAACLAAHLIMLTFVDRRGWDYVDLGRRAIATRPVAGGLALGAGALAVPCAILLAVGWLVIVGGPAADGGGARISRELLTVLAVLVPAAFAEELMIRGYLLSALSDGIGRLAALVLTSVAFALMHAKNPGMEPGALVVVGLAGVFLGAVRFATSSLYAAWAAHLAWTAVLGIVLHALVSGTTVAAAGWRTLDAGPDWATGGSWGPEGGIGAAAGLLVATWYLIGRHRAAFAGGPFASGTDRGSSNEPHTNGDGARA
jgi:membrane protease YdiL (CAAX protease family)